MTTSAIIFMIVSMIILWGGLAASIVHLRGTPELDDSEPTSAADDPQPSD